MNSENQTPGNSVQEKVWDGKSDRQFQQRADIFEPGANGDFQKTGKGGVSFGPPASAPQPAPKPAAKPAPQPVRTPANQSQALAEAVTSSFVDRLKSEAKRKGGVLNLDDIEVLSGEFTKKTEALKMAFEKSFDEYVTTRERSALNLSREFPFDRLIVSKFARLLRNDNQLLQEDDTVSRRILPGFFMAMNMMMGQEFVENKQEATRRIVLRLSKGREDEFTWEEVFADAEAKELVFDAEVAMAFYFEDFKKRIHWFVGLMNDHMRPFEKGTNPDLHVWTFTEGAIRKLLKDLFSDLKEAISSEAGRLMISKKYGVDTCVTLADILKQFE